MAAAGSFTLALVLFVACVSVPKVPGESKYATRRYVTPSHSCDSWYMSHRYPVFGYFVGSLGLGGLPSWRFLVFPNQGLTAGPGGRDAMLPDGPYLEAHGTY